MKKYLTKILVIIMFVGFVTYATVQTLPTANPLPIVAKVQTILGTQSGTGTVTLAKTQTQSAKTLITSSRQSKVS